MNTDEQTLTIIPRSDILIDGAHAPAGEAIEVRARTATALLNGGFATIAKAPAAEKRETAANPPPAGAETGAANAPINPKPVTARQRRTAK